MNQSLRFVLLPALLWATLLAPTRAQTQLDPVLVGTTSEGADGFGAIFQFTPPASGTITPTVQKLLGNQAPRGRSTYKTKRGESLLLSPPSLL